LLHAHGWARPPAAPGTDRGRNAKSIDEKESFRWLQAFPAAAAAARRMPQSQWVGLADREGDLYDLHDAVQIGPPNRHAVLRAPPDRKWEGHQKLWAFMAAQPLGKEQRWEVPRRRGQSARPATVPVRWAQILIQAPAVGCKKGWPSLSLWAVWVRKPQPPAGVEPIEWRLGTDWPVTTWEQAWEKGPWYGRRWGIEEWPRALQNGCGVERREFKKAEHWQRVLALDLIIAWRVLAGVQWGRARPQLPASVWYSPDERQVLGGALKKGRAALARGT
jgi:hypothetical protein